MTDPILAKAFACADATEQAGMNLNEIRKEVR